MNVVLSTQARGAPTPPSCGSHHNNRAVPSRGVAVAAWTEKSVAPTRGVLRAHAIGTSASAIALEGCTRDALRGWCRIHFSTTTTRPRPTICTSLGWSAASLSHRRALHAPPPSLVPTNESMFMFVQRNSESDSLFPSGIFHPKKNSLM